ncbi:amino acid transporter AVT1E-like [Coffea arabica]|uniref:Amino acid transporter AVT1E-like n=1 Tax=Coffea arabica TaxID=13443 RepID=A0A6P6SX60_COFAR
MLPAEVPTPHGGRSHKHDQAPSFWGKKSRITNSREAIGVFFHCRFVCLHAPENSRPLFSNSGRRVRYPNIKGIIMKLEGEYRPDRHIEIDTDDEENRAERFSKEDEEEEDDDDDDDSEPDFAAAPPLVNSSSSSVGSHSSGWPQSYRQSMDMYTSVTPSSFSFLRGSSPPTSANKRPQITVRESSFTRPLISPTIFDKEEVTCSQHFKKLPVASGSRLSIEELPTPKQCSYVQTILNAINALCGIGILSTPYAVKEGGWLSLILLLIFGVITCYTGILLKRCLESSPELETYPDIGQAAFGMIGRICIAIVLYLELYSSCVEYLIMMSDNMASMFPHAHLDFAGIHMDSYQLCAIVSTLVILPTVWLRNLSSLSYISVGGVIMLVVVVICLLWVGVINEVGFHPGGRVFDLAKLPLTIGLYSFCYGSHSVFPDIYSSMKEPSQFPSILVISFSTAFFLYTGVAICGFSMFGDAVKPQFTLNLPTRFNASGVAALVVVLTPVSKYALTLIPVAFGLEDLLPSSRLRSYGVSMLIRTMLVGSTLAIALTVPYFGSVMALIGSLLVMLVSLILPCACYIRISGGKLTNLQIAVCTVIMVVGLLCSIVGTYSAITNLQS